MAQDRVDDFFEMAKDMAKAEKELEVQHWVFISIEYFDHAINTYVRLWQYDLPREVYKRREWVVSWRRAWLQCRYPKHCICQYMSYYDKRLGNNANMQKCLNELISAKAQVTKVRRKIEEYVSYNKEHNLFFDESTDADLIAAREKLARKEANVKAAEERMKAKIAELNNQ